MTPPTGFDPSAELAPSGESPQPVEAWIGRIDDERLRFGYERPDGQIVLVTLRGDFLDEFLAQARAREVDAA